ncbi:ELOVL fatty acid elongase 8b isoform X1 [Austrofundulus limnaeus]|uniref:Elongation of very long chain fatty acids protein n=1 Tax=Austrofundulus limnaeus TaxID=52670 RepID=A0A2I4AS98_AUSLI|nr:PREDICTED: elongation of very long chain fatty acids protein 4-like isoform X1 [Austrofundulus limnaeus]
MASLWQNVLAVHQWIVENGDKRTDPWLLVYSPVPVALIFLVYLGGIWAGPRLMKHREPVDLKLVLIWYNFSMVLLSAYMFHEFLVTSWLSDYSLLCQPVDYSSRPLAMRMARVCWWFFFSKVIELSDTLFFILRKKNNQLTFLHVYHHGTMIFNCVLHRPGKHLRSHRHVLLLRPGSVRASHAEVPVVETIPDVPAAAAVFPLPPAHGLQPVHRLQLPRLHERCGVCLLRHPHRPLHQLLFSELPEQEEAEMRPKRLQLLCLVCPPEGATCPQSAGFYH